jgi:hypothetical protein
MTTSVDIPIPATPGARAAAVDGPRWVPGAVPYDTRQTDGRGVTWEAVGLEQGGRVIRWRSRDGARAAVTTAVEGHPHYPSDAEVLETQRRDRRAEQLGWR